MGFKDFLCSDGTSGFTLRLNALFGAEGYRNAWSVVKTWGTASGMTGAGWLWGVGFDGGVGDHSEGTLTFR